MVELLLLRGKIFGCLLSPKVVAVYPANVSPSMKQYIQEHWRKGVTRILVATSAWGTGINDPRVERVVLWRQENEQRKDVTW